MLTSNQIRTTFRAFGKFIKLGQMADIFAHSLKGHEVATADQITSADPETYSLFKGVVIPLELSVGRVISGLDTVPLRARQALESYLAQQADALGVSRAATMAAKLNALKTAMLAQEETIEPSGASNTDGFYSYFMDTYGVALPASDDATIYDNLITTVVV